MQHVKVNCNRRKFYVRTYETFVAFQMLVKDVMLQSDKWRHCIRMGYTRSRVYRFKCQNCSQK
jgi:hypothetical protein